MSGHSGVGIVQKDETEGLVISIDFFFLVVAVFQLVYF